MGYATSFMDYGTTKKLEVLIVCIVYQTRLKKPTLIFLAKPLLNLQPVPTSLFRQCSLYIDIP